MNCDFERCNTTTYNTQDMNILDTLSIFMYCSNDVIEPIEEYIARGGDVNLRINNKNSLLCVACENDNYEIAELLLNSGADPDILVAEKSPLYFSSEKVIELLLKYKANPNIYSVVYGYPLWSSFFRKDNAAKLLIEGGATVDISFLCYSQRHDLFPFVKRLTRWGKIPVLMFSLYLKDYEMYYQECDICRRFCKDYFFEVGLILKEVRFPFLFVVGVIQNLCGYPEDEIVKEFGFLWYTKEGLF
jgi:Ankyrin repeat